MIATPDPPRMTAADYLDWEPQQEIRYEFVNGRVIAMTGGTIPHNDLALNLYSFLRPKIKKQGCRLNVADVKVQIADDYRYPDVVVSCDKRDSKAVELYRYPSLIVEVLSPGTAAVDRGEKFNQYRSLETLQEYVLIDSEKMGVEIYRRGEGRMWLYYPYVLGDTVRFDSLGIECPIETIYEDVQLGITDR
ncbi:MAG: Uma2 family endonuclease [Cyanobacteria bacterium P01_A01_bin.114]